MSTPHDIPPTEPTRLMTHDELVTACQLRVERGNQSPIHGRHTAANVDELVTVPEVRARLGAAPIERSEPDPEQTQPIYTRRPRLRPGVVVGDLLAGDGPHSEGVDR